MNASDKIKKLSQLKVDLRTKMEETNNELLKLVEDTMYEVVKSNPNPPKMIGDKCMTIRLSDMMDHPWSPGYYNWKESVNVLLEYLKQSKKPVEDWKEYLQSRLEGSKTTDIYFEKYTYWAGTKIRTVSYPISRLLIERIVESI